MSDLIKIPVVSVSSAANENGEQINFPLINPGSGGELIVHRDGTGLSATEIREMRNSIAPDEDALVLKINEGQFALLKYNAFQNSGVFSDPRFQKAPLTVHAVVEGDKIETAEFGLFQIIDHVENNGLFLDFVNHSVRTGSASFQMISVKGEQFPALIRPDVKNISNLNFCTQLILDINGKRIQMIVPEDFSDVVIGDTLTFSVQDNKGKPTEYSGKIINFQAADRQVVSVVTSDGSVSGELQSVESEEKWQPQHRPFEDELLVRSDDGSFYALTVPANFEGFKVGDPIAIDFEALTPEGRPTQDRFRGTIAKFDNVESKTKYKLNSISYSVISSDPDVPVPPVYQHEIESVIKNHNPFEEGKEFKNFNYREKVKTLQKRLLKFAYDVEVIPEWSEQNQSFNIRIRVTAPPNEIEPQVQFDRNTFNWILQKMGGDENKFEAFAEELRDEIERNVLLPCTAEKLKYTTRKVRELNRKHPEFNFEMTSHYLDNGILNIAVNIAAKPQSAFISIVDGKQEKVFDSEEMGIRHRKPFDPNDETSPRKKLKSLFRKNTEKKEERGSIVESDHEDPLDPREAAQVVKKMFHKISDNYAQENKILVVKRGDKVMPYQPMLDYQAALENRLKLSAIDFDGQEIPIETYDAEKLKFSFTPPQDANGKELGPNHVENWFKNGGKLTSESIAEGINRLTTWYQHHGYALVDNHINYEIVDGTLKIEAPIYQLSGDIEFAWGNPDENIMNAADKNAREPLSDELKRKMMNEFRLKDGDLYNKRSFLRSIESINRRFRFIAAPIEVTQPDGTIKLGVVVTHIKWDDILNQLELKAGYDTNGVTIGGNYDVVMHGGKKLSASATASPFASVYGGGVGISTAADERGGHWNFGASGAYRGADMYYGEGKGSVSEVNLNSRYSRAIGQSDWSWFGEAGASYLLGDSSIEGTHALYGKPSVGVRYNGTDEMGEGLSAEISAGPRFSRHGVYGEFGGSVNYRQNIGAWGENNRVYAEAWARAGILIGNAPEAAMWQSAPTNLMGIYTLASPIKAYGSVGGAIMTEMPGDFVDVGIGTSAGFLGPVFSAGAGIRLKVRAPGMGNLITIMIGPAIVNGIPTPITFISN